jgi:hypothetical protein
MTTSAPRAVNDNAIAQPIASKASDDRWTAAKNVIRSDSAIRAGVTDL